MTAVVDPSADFESTGKAIEPGFYDDRWFEDIVRWVCPTPDVRRDIVRVMVRDFSDGLEVRSRLSRGPRLFVSNHQMASDVIYFSVLVAGLSHQRAELATWVGHYDLDAGQMNRWMHTRPEGSDRTVASTIRPRMVDPREPREVKGVAHSMAGQMRRVHGTFGCLCVAGQTERYEGEPMDRTGGAFLDAALAHDIPITPARFNWGSTDTPGTRNMWSKHLAKQRYVVGEDITPDDLKTLSRPQQRSLVTDAINALVLPRPADHFAKSRPRENRIRWLSDTVGMGLTKAIFLDGLYRTPFQTLTDEGRQLVIWSAVPEAGDRAKADEWLYQFARWLSDGFGPARVDLSPHYPELATTLSRRP
ncbi:MAG: hypothetical protein AAGB11_01500 [Pseudomonadota bacterium]